MASNWDKAASTFRGALSEAIDAEALRALHVIRPAPPDLVEQRQLLVLALAAALFLIDAAITNAIFF